MKKKHEFLIFAILFCFLCTGGIYADFESRVAVLPLVSLDGDDRFTSIGSAIHDTVALTLNLLGKYDVIDETGLSDFTREEIIPYSEEKNVDSVIFGSIQQGEDGSIVIQMSVWDRQRREIVLAVEEKAEMLFDVFDASDRIVITLMEGFSSGHIGYGSIVLKPEGENSSYLIELNGSFAGINKKELRNVLIGSYNLTIRQERPFGSHILFSDSVEVNEHEETAVVFAIPTVTDEERAFFDSLDERIITGWTDPEKKVELRLELKEVTEALSAFDGFFADEHNKYRTWSNKLPIRKTSDINMSTREIDVKLAKERLRDVLLLPSGSLFPGVENDRDRNAPFAAGSFFSRRISYVEELKQHHIPRVNSGDIKIDGKRRDWVSLPAIIKDKGLENQKEGADLVSVKIARDDEKIYALFSVEGDKILSTNDVWVQTFFNTDFGNVMLNCYYGEGNWRAFIAEWIQSEWKSQEIAVGSVKKGRGFLEASFPYSVLVDILGTDKKYLVQAQFGGPDGQRDFADGSASIILD